MRHNGFARRFVVSSILGSLLAILSVAAAFANTLGPGFPG